MNKIIRFFLLFTFLNTIVLSSGYASVVSHGAGPVAVNVIGIMCGRASLDIMLSKGNKTTLVNNNDKHLKNSKKVSKVTKLFKSTGKVLLDVCLLASLFTEKEDKIVPASENESGTTVFSGQNDSSFTKIYEIHKEEYLIHSNKQAVMGKYHDLALKKQTASTNNRINIQKIHAPPYGMRNILCRTVQRIVQSSMKIISSDDEAGSLNTIVF